MDRLNNNTNKGKGKHLNYEKRLKIEALSKAGLKSEAIGAIIGCSGRAIRNELAKGKVRILNSDLTTREEYSADVGQQKHEYAGSEKGPRLKIGNEYELVAYIEEKIIKEKMSPYINCIIKIPGNFQIKRPGKRMYNTSIKSGGDTCVNKVNNTGYYENIKTGRFTKTEGIYGTNLILVDNRHKVDLKISPLC